MMPMRAYVRHLDSLCRHISDGYSSWSRSTARHIYSYSFTSPYPGRFVLCERRLSDNVLICRRSIQIQMKWKIIRSNHIYFRLFESLHCIHSHSRSHHPSAVGCRAAVIRFKPTQLNRNSHCSFRSAAFCTAATRDVLSPTHCIRLGFVTFQLRVGSNRRLFLLSRLLLSHIFFCFVPPPANTQITIFILFYIFFFSSCFYHRTGAAAASRLFNEALAKIAVNAQQGGTTDIGKCYFIVCTCINAAEHARHIEPNEHR